MFLVFLCWRSGAFFMTPARKRSIRNAALWNPDYRVRAFASLIYPALEVTL